MQPAHSTLYRVPDEISIYYYYNFLVGARIALSLGEKRTHRYIHRARDAGEEIHKHHTTTI